MTTNESTTSVPENANEAVHDIAVRERGSAVTEFVRDHPVLVVAGGVAAGLLVGALIPRRTGKAIVKRSSKLADLIGAAAVSLGEDAAHRASSAGTQLRKGSHVVADKAEDWTAIALHGASVFAQSAAQNLSKLSEAAAERAEALGEVAADQVGKAGQEAAKRFNKAVPVAEAAAAHAGKKAGNALSNLRSRVIG